MLFAISLSQGYIVERKWWKAMVKLRICMTLATPVTLITVHPRKDESEVKPLL
jgi:hypothetical protein